MQTNEEYEKDVGAQAPNQKVLSVPAAAGRLGVTKQTFYGWARTRPGFPKIFKIGAKKSGVLEGELDAWIVGAWQHGGGGK